MKFIIKKITILFAIFLFTVSGFIEGQENMWKNKKCAVSLTYDDALNTHLDNVIPLLDTLGLKGTFYLSGYFPVVNERLNDWRKAAAKGHELGNHTLFHPCVKNIPNREWVNPEYALDNYSVERMRDEIKMGNVLFKATDGKTVRTFAYPCGEMNAGDSSYVNDIKNDFIAARSVERKIEQINSINLFDIGSYMINGESGEKLIELVEEAKEKNGLIVFLFHGVGGEHSLNVSLEAHRELVEYLKGNEDQIWTAPLVEIAEYVKEVREKR